MLLKIWYQIHFIYYEYFQYVFSQHFLNYNFYIILNNNTSKPIPNMLKVVNPFYLAKINNCEPFLNILVANPVQCTEESNKSYKFSLIKVTT